uniref:flagellar hook-basal body protein n=1 Tax=Candidatus Enterococcus willemsii TaxID=1857215 RepID=UPI00403F9B19
MIRAFDTLTKNFDILQKRQENISSNMANSQTTGYQSKQLFQQTLREVEIHNYQNGARLDQRSDLGTFTFGNEIGGINLNMEKGAFEETGRPTDFAIGTEGYFAVRLPNGQTGYTRNGNFVLNDQNQYTTQEGYLVLGGNNQPVLAENPNFQVVTFANPQALTSEGNTYFQSNAAVQAVENPRVFQGYLETSNVTVADEMVAMIQTSREFEANQKVLSTTNETLRKTVNELGRF